MTVIFIIALLISILIPSIGAARIAAKKATTAKTLDTIKSALEMFKNDNEQDFRQTNGYPPSFVHPPIPGYPAFTKEIRLRGGFPFLTEGTFPQVYGAHWLPAMLMGIDALGYVQRKNVPRREDLHQKPWLWYTDDPLLDLSGPLPRAPLYLDSANTRFKLTKDLPGTPPSNKDIFPNLEDVQNLPVLVDSFDQPILYYVANPHGKTTNMLADVRDLNNNYTGGPQQEGTPYYFHQDNLGFTGRGAEKEEDFGWTFSGRRKPHQIAISGADLDAEQIVNQFLNAEDKNQRQTFARYIMDRQIWTSILEPDVASSTTPLRPVNADSYLLISAGPDGVYGTLDDVSNLPPFPSNSN